MANKMSFFQLNYSLDACVSGCDIFSKIEFNEGTHQPLENLKNCNYSKYFLTLEQCSDIHTSIYLFVHKTSSKR